MAAKRSTKSSATAAVATKKSAVKAAPAPVKHASEEEKPQQQGQSDTEDEESDAEEADGSGDETQSDVGDAADDNDDDGLELDAEAPDGDDEGDDEEEELDAVGFGDAMSKILGQNVAGDAQPILAKRTTSRMREILAEKKVTKTARISAAEKREKEQKDMVIPDHSTVVQDRRLRTIATKGVVALFNAIEKHQHQNGKKSDDKNDKKVKEMSKDNFLGLLKASQKSVGETPAPAPTAAKSSWSVVQDDYMMGAKKLKEWDATHGTEQGRVRNHDDDETEAAEDAAWKQVGDLDSDDEGGAKAPAAAASGKRKNSKSSDRKPAGKKAKRS